MKAASALPVETPKVDLSQRRSRAAAPAASRVGPRTAALSSVSNPAALPPKLSPLVTVGFATSTLLGVVPSLLQQTAIAVHLGPTRSPFNQTVDLNGTDLVPASTELVTSFYGAWTYAPGGLNIFQGQQDYNVVDPVTGLTSGNFTALVSSGKPLGLSRYAELLVTSSEGNVGTGAGQTPPAGSVIANLRIIGKFGWNYSAMPSPSGDVVSFKLTTPFGDIRIRRLERFDGAEGIADHTVDDRPVDLGNGYSIAPSDPAAETYTGMSGLLPMFQGIQTRQQYDVRDSAGATVGTFDGVATTTRDAVGWYTQAILVTDSHGDNVGTGVGQVPPTGTVYNVVYVGNDANYVLYTSMPAPSGDVILMIQSRRGKVTNISKPPANRLDASNPPPVKRLPFAGGYGILPISELTPTGVNGLPPRDVQLQGYQRFAVYDPTGVATGSFDAMVSQQWDWLGISSQAMVVTNVVEGESGTGDGDVPPVGSVLSYVSFRHFGLGTSYWSLPSSSGTRTSFKILNPLFDIPTWSSYDASAGLDTVTFGNPF